jgi:hypothetical protein
MALQHGNYKIDSNSEETTIEDVFQSNYPDSPVQTPTEQKGMFRYIIQVNSNICSKDILKNVTYLS